MAEFLEVSVQIREWNLTKATEATKIKVYNLLEKAATVVWMRMREKVSVQGDAKNPSEPGQPPHRRSGALYESILTTPVIGGSRAGSLYIQVGPHRIYDARLEFGFVGVDSAGRTVDQAARPYVRSSLQESKKEVAAIMKARGRQR